MNYDPETEQGIPVRKVYGNMNTKSKGSSDYVTPNMKVSAAMLNDYAES